jgi:hypothetical protein
MRNKIIALFVLLFCLNLQGCAIGAIAAGIGAAKWGSSKKIEAQAKSKEAYNQYLIQMNKINISRQKAGLKPEPIISFKNYVS